MKRSRIKLDVMNMVNNGSKSCHRIAVVGHSDA